jgi:glycosyltransferase involved in cell wall biosynthesis
LRSSLESRASLSLVHWADIVVFCRNTEPAYAHLLSEALSTHKPIVFDLDDNFWDVPFDSDPELARYHRLPLRIQQLEKYLKHATLVRVYSPALQEIVSRFNSNARLLKAGFDFDLVAASTAKRRRSDVVQIVYATSRIVDNQYLLFAEALRKVMKVYNNRVSMTIWGCQPAELVGAEGIKFMPLIPNYNEFLRSFASHSFDIGLAPLEDTPFHRSKTNTKFRDYGASKVAGIYSNVCVYSSCVNDKETGLLVDNNADSWWQGMSLLIENASLRQSIQENAYREVYEEYRQEVVADEWMSEISELLSNSTSYSLNASNAASATKEVLIRSDAEGLAGIVFPSASPGDNEPVPKIALEICSPEGNIIRDASSTQFNRSDCDGQICVGFPPIRNSKAQEFILRFIPLPDDSEAMQPSWIPTSAFIEMYYSQANECRNGARARNSCLEKAVFGLAPDVVNTESSSNR